jgi:hypothetical protein
MLAGSAVLKRNNKYPINQRMYPRLYPEQSQPQNSKTVDISVERSDVRETRNRSELERESIESLLQIAVVEGTRQGMNLRDLVEKVRKFWIDANDHSV